jgi:hypothetical protein
VANYRSKSDAIDAELDSLAPDALPDLDGARAVLEDFGRFWSEEHDRTSFSKRLSGFQSGIAASLATGDTVVAGRRPGFVRYTAMADGPWLVEPDVL